MESKLGHTPKASPTVQMSDTSQYTIEENVGILVAIVIQEVIHADTC